MTQQPLLDSLPSSTWVQERLDRWRKGSNAAANELLRALSERLERLARKMLRGFPRVRSLAETADVLAEATIRLLHSLRKLRPAHTRDLINLAAVQIRRELLDLARHFRKRIPVLATAGDAELDEPAAPDTTVEELELWSRFHQAVEQLPTEKREAFSLTFYHGWTQPQIAELLQVDERTIRRWLDSARELLREQLNGQWPTEAE
jgi:RNA polymerase sigma-70 factor (ECF subfamily)